MVQQVVSWLTELPQRSGRFGVVSKVDHSTEGVGEAWLPRMDRALATLVVAALLVAIGHYAVVLGHSRAAIADFHPLNGDFQNFNPVKRLFQGEHPGRDFDSYLGLGPTCLLYVFMLPLGSDFASSLFATHVLHAISTAAAIALLCRLCGLPMGWSCLLGWFTLVYARNPNSLPIRDYLHECLSELVQPGNSSLGLRCLAPLLAAPAIVWVLRRFGPERSGDVRLAGLCLGTIGGTLLPWSNDHGLSMAIALLLLGAPWLYWRSGNTLSLWERAGVRVGSDGNPLPKGEGTFQSRLRGIQAVTLMPLAMGLSTSLVLLALTAGSPREWFAYNFLNVAKDQFWYFIGPSSKITTIYDIPIYRGVLLALACLGLLAWKIRRTGCRPEDLVLAFLVLSNLLAGYVSISGSRGERYFFPLYRCLAVVVPYLAFSGIALVLRARQTPAVREIFGRRGGQMAAAAAGALVVCTVLAARGSYQEQRQRESTAAALLDVPELGGKLSHHFSKVIAVGREIRARAEAAGVPDQQRLFSTYATAMDVVAGAPHAARSDYIIHALGPQRRSEYVRQLAEVKPLFVSTIRDDFTPWEYWLRTVNWDFYAQLLKDYKPTDRTLYNVVWERRSEPAAWPDVPLETTITQGADSDVQLAIHFPPASLPGSTQRHLVEVEIDYDWNWKFGRVLRGALRPYLFARDEARPEGWGLPHYERIRRFPVELAPGETSVVTLACMPLDSTKLSVRRCTARVLLPKSEIDGFELSRLRASSLSDDNWTKGIWIHDPRAGFFVADYSDLRMLQPGSRLRFRASGERVVESLTGDQVWLQGPVLDPTQDGYPHPIEIVAR